MADTFGSDYMTIIDEDGIEYEIEVLTTLEYNNCIYMAVTSAVFNEEEPTDPEISILKSVEDEDGEPILSAIEDKSELEQVYNLIMEQLYEEEDE